MDTNQLVQNQVKSLKILIAVLFVIIIILASLSTVLFNINTRSNTATLVANDKGNAVNPVNPINPINPVNPVLVTISAVPAASPNITTTGAPELTGTTSITKSPIITNTPLISTTPVLFAHTYIVQATDFPSDPLNYVGFSTCADSSCNIFGIMNSKLAKVIKTVTYKLSFNSMDSCGAAAGTTSCKITSDFLLEDLNLVITPKQFTYTYSVQAVKYEPNPDHYVGFKTCSDSSCHVYGLPVTGIAKAVLGGTYSLSFNTTKNCSAAAGTTYCEVDSTFELR